MRAAGFIIKSVPTGRAALVSSISPFSSSASSLLSSLDDGDSDESSRSHFLVRVASSTCQKPRYAYAAARRGSGRNVSVDLSYIDEGEDPLRVDWRRYAEENPPDEMVDEREIEYVAPIEPKWIVCIGLNYKKHAAEVGMDLPKYPVFFTKPPSSILDANKNIIIPKVAASPPEVDYEVEMGIVIGRASSPCKNVSEKDALAHVLGFVSANDVSARRWQSPKRGGGQWCRAKSFDTFCPVGPGIRLSDPVLLDPENLRLQTTVNGTVVQSSCTSDLNFSPPALISFLSQSTTLEPGTLILTGTPEGVGYTRDPPLYLKAGDVVECAVQGCGVVKNGVADEV